MIQVFPTTPSRLIHQETKVVVEIVGEALSFQKYAGMTQE